MIRVFLRRHVVGVLQHFMAIRLFCSVRLLIDFLLFVVWKFLQETFSMIGYFTVNKNGLKEKQLSDFYCLFLFRWRSLSSSPLPRLSFCEEEEA